MLVRLDSYFDQIKYDIKYATDDNFIGRPIIGYNKNLCLISLSMVEPLRELIARLSLHSYQLMILDAYRPARALQDMYKWSLDKTDQKNKNKFYPNIEKNKLFDHGYLSLTSNHSRGVAIDITLLNCDGVELDFGTTFDFFDRRSHFSCAEISESQKKNRKMLREIMQNVGFIPYDKEWWHFRLDCQLSKHPVQDIMVE
jgi:D-alanyl-D-alanine dipeptidase